MLQLHKNKKTRMITGVVIASLVLVLPFVLARPSRAILRIGNYEYRLAVAATAEAKERGLSGRAGLATNEGMLFVYDKPQKVCMWMKDMSFPIDIIWLDAGKKVVHMSKDVSPETYPASFCANAPAKYVIELPAGELARRHITEGQQLSL